MKEIFTYVGYVAVISGLVALLVVIYRESAAFFTHKFTWRRVERGVCKLVRHMKEDNYDPDFVVGIGRSGGIIGGLIVGHLSTKGDTKAFRVLDYGIPPLIRT